MNVEKFDRILRKINSRFWDGTASHEFYDRNTTRLLMAIRGRDFERPLESLSAEETAAVDLIFAWRDAQDDAFSKGLAAKHN